MAWRTGRRNKDVPAPRLYGPRYMAQCRVRSGHGTLRRFDCNLGAIRVQSAARARGPVGSPSGEHRDCRVRRFGEPVRRSAPASTAGPLRVARARCWRRAAVLGLGVASVRQESGPRRNVNAEFRLQGLFDSHHAAAASIRAAGNLTPVNRVNSVRINLARLSTVTHTRRGTANETCRAAPAHIAGRRHRP